MKRNNYFKIIELYISLLCLLSVFKKSSQQTFKKLNLYEGDICRKGNESEPNYLCQRAENCDSIEEHFRKQNYPDICLFDGNDPIYCCIPKNMKTTNLKSHPIKSLSIANDKCRQYGDLYKKMYACDKEDQFTCLDGECINKKYVCDNEFDPEADCEDKYDENDSVCETWTCHEDYFKCGNNKCIVISRVCDGRIHCADGSDESINTCKTWNCGEYFFKCGTNKCIYRKDMCDGNNDCQDGSDEDATMCKLNWPINRSIPSSNFVSDGKPALSQEFSHMALLGFGDTIDKVNWQCGGSLVSERWVLSAAHCQQSGAQRVNWVRLGDLNIVSGKDDAQPIDYRIVRRVIHPEYKKTSYYNDIALFRLEKDVEFSKYVWPICLNTNSSVDPNVQLIATGWGATGPAESMSDHLLKVNLYPYSSEQCNDTYFSNTKLKYGITSDSIICAGSPTTEEDTCQGDSGGPLQVKNNDFTKMHTQIGITSFGNLCGSKNIPGGYTRVSKYISWIEEIVWPVN